jgi:DNA (cytosine-5)-methyltransferase 1
MSLKVGGLFAGTGGLELGLASVLDTEPEWFAEFDVVPSKILAHHWPDVPNYGDVTKVDWASVPPVDVITGGSPCQDLSHAGKRAGMKAGTRSGLWASMCDAVEIIRPRLVVWENVRGALSAEADSAVESCPLCVGDRPGTTLRALGRVLGDLSELGYDSWWYGLRAADVGAAHGRFRVFVYATPADAIGGGWDGWALDAHRRPVERVAAARGGEVPDGLTLLPTPAVNDMGDRPWAREPGAWDAWVEKNGHGKSLAIEAQRLLPTPRATDGTKGGPNQRGSSGDLMLPSAVQKMLPTPSASQGDSLRTSDGFNDLGRSIAMLPETVQDWREYEAAIRRQEHAFGRPAPLPTEPGAKGQPRLSPAFVEWLMGLPEGWVTDVPGITRNDQMKALGNGVVPPQAAAATRAFLADMTRQAVA